jgi:hypothetical protein
MINAKAQRMINARAQRAQSTQRFFVVLSRKLLPDLYRSAKLVF